MPYLPQFRPSRGRGRELVPRFCPKGWEFCTISIFCDITPHNAIVNGEVHLHIEPINSSTSARSGYLVCFPLFVTKFIIFVHISILRHKAPYRSPALGQGSVGILYQRVAPRVSTLLSNGCKTPTCPLLLARLGGGGA